MYLCRFKHDNIYMRYSTMDMNTIWTCIYAKGQAKTLERIYLVVKCRELSLNQTKECQMCDYIVWGKYIWYANMHIQCKWNRKVQTVQQHIASLFLWPYETRF